MRFGKTRRWLAAEVVQTSGMDCGPASLKCLLEGFGVPVSYGRLREACQTDVDGTSIDTLEEVANQLGLEAEQVMVPVDHVLRAGAKALPAIVVVRLPNGVTHFVVIWSRHGGVVQVMDPAVGRRMLPTRELLDQLYVHEMPVPADAWRAWAGDVELVVPLRQRLLEIGVSGRRARRLISKALEDPTWVGPGALDAAARMVSALVEAGGVQRGGAARRLLEALFERARQAPDAPDGEAAVPAAYWTVRPATPGPEGEARVLLRGAVLVRAVGRRKDVHTETLSPELQAALKEKPPHPGRHLLAMLFADGAITPFVLIFALLLAAGGVLIEALLFRGIFEIGTSLGLFGQRLGFVGMLVGLAVTLLMLELATRAGLQRLGRHLEARLRRAFLAKIPRLGDRYFQSRLSSDMAERSHALHVLRVLPGLAGQALRSGFGLVLTALAISWLDPASAPYAALAAGMGLLLPLLIQPALTRRDLRLRTHVGALTRFYLDALLGLVAARTHGAEKAIRRDHEGLLVDWTQAGMSVQRAAVAVDGLVALSGYALTALLLFRHVSTGGQGGAVLLLVYWSLSLPVLGQRLALASRQYPSLRNVTLRLLEPLGAPEEPVAASPAPTGTNGNGVHIEVEGVTVVAGGQVILRDIRVEIPPGQHLAVVGPSGAGKSSLVGLFLGWHRPAAGELRIDGKPLDAGRLAELRREIAWVDPAVQLWNRSLFENLRYGSENGDGAPLVEVLDTADLRHLLDLVPEGLQTALGESGGLVSGGEGQRVRLGRALLRRDARLVILDEPFRGLDREKRRVLLEKARRWWHRATFVFITHDVEQAATFSRVLVIEGGGVAEDGDPARLAADPESRLAALIESERAVRSGLWSGPHWRRLWLEGGRLSVRDPQDGPAVEAPSRVETPEPVAAGATAKSGRDERFTWPMDEIGQALQAVIRESGLPALDADLPETAGAASEADLTRVSTWIEAAAQRMGLEAEPVQTTYADLERFSRAAGPALVVLERAEGRRILALSGQSRRGARVLGPDLRVRRLSAERVTGLLSAEIDTRYGGATDALMESARVPRRRRGAVRRALLRQQLASQRVAGAWILRMQPGGRFLDQLRQEGLLGWLGGLLAAHATHFLLFLISWWLLGRGALGGTLEIGWLAGWALVLFSAIPFQMLATWCQGLFALGAAGLMKRRLLLGALRLEPEQIRHQGSGQLLGRVIESEALESMALSGGFLALTSSVELVAAAWVLGNGAGGAVHVALLAVWIGLTLLLGRRLIWVRGGWTDARLGITNDLVERMVGHRTRLAQEAPERWHEGEDRALEGYLGSGRRMDTLTVALQALVARGWTILGLLVLVPPFLSGSTSAIELAIAIGGLLLAQQALESAAMSISDLGGAAIAWRQVAPLFKVAARRETPASLALALTGRRQSVPGSTLLEASDLVFGYAGRPQPILSGCSLTLRHGDRVLLEGPSGGGKSTLASLMVGLRRPQSGLLLLNGLDRHTLGPQGWRAHVTAAPQFHENHVFTETFAFNLLMGRRWPAPQEDFDEAEALCRELGLGPLLERMPSGLLQIVGETGWQLSHGERSRLFLARALLQRTDLVVLDESFAALDPENLERALRCVLARAPTLVVIAHP